MSPVLATPARSCRHTNPEFAVACSHTGTTCSPEQASKLTQIVKMPKIGTKMQRIIDEIDEIDVIRFKQPQPSSADRKRIP
jgi:hypothetical protein